MVYPEVGGSSTAVAEVIIQTLLPERGREIRKERKKTSEWISQSRRQLTLKPDVGGSRQTPSYCCILNPTSGKERYI